jgi:hypothetical protein
MNIIPAAIGASIADVETPALIVELDRRWRGSSGGHATRCGGI